MPNPIRILGLDPGLRRTGWGVIAVDGARLGFVAHGVIRPDDKAPFAERLLHLLNGLAEVLATHRPDEAAVEEIFVSVNAASTLKLGHARAMALVAPAQAGLPVAEYAARQIKQCVVGTGAADKTQVGFMIRRLLPACGDPGADAADALAVAITHANLRRMKRLAA